MPGAYLWGWDTDRYRKVVVDAAGHLQVDVLSGAGVASQLYGWDGDSWEKILVESAGNANLRTSLYHGTNQIVSVATPDDIADENRGLLTHSVIRGIDGTFLKAINAEENGADAIANDRISLSTLGKLYGYNGVSWDRLRVESSTAFNLRVKLYDGANGIDSDLFSFVGFVATAKRGLYTRTELLLSWSATEVQAWRAAYLESDDTFGTGIATVALWGYNGAKWDRLRTYPTGILKVGRAEIGATTIRMTGTGQVGSAAAKKLFWIACTPDDPNAEWQLADATASGGAIVYDHFDTDKHSDHITFDPPMEFSNGIYLEKFDHQTSLVFSFL